MVGNQFPLMLQVKEQALALVKMFPVERNGRSQEARKMLS
jgi:hypothetical protein